MSLYSTFDLTTSLTAGSDLFVPSVKAGILSLSIDFSKPIFEETTILAFCHYSSVLEIDKNRKVSLSYLNVEK